MRAYTAPEEEALRARNLLKDWLGQGFLTHPQYLRMRYETVCGLRRTNIFLRVVLFLFTLLIVGAGVGLVFIAFSSSHPSEHATGFFMLIMAALAYGAAEFAVFHFRLYRYGIEEALAVSAAGFLCVGIQLTWFGASSGTATGLLAAGMIVSLWLWYRFGLPYAFLAAMLFAALLLNHWTSSQTALHLAAAAVYASSLIVGIIVRASRRLTNPGQGDSLVEALLWLGVYLAINLRLDQSGILQRASPGFSRIFYWFTWVSIWCLPPVVLTRGLRIKDRFVIAVGAIVALLTLITNKPYLHWRTHTWDPMLLGALLIGFALWLRRWLAAGPGGIRHGFTAQRLSGNDQRWLNAGPATFTLLTPNPLAMNPQPSAPHFGGGDSGGGGATSDF